MRGERTQEKGIKRRKKEGKGGKGGKREGKGGKWRDKDGMSFTTVLQAHVVKYSSHIHIHIHIHVHAFMYNATDNSTSPVPCH